MKCYKCKEDKLEVDFCFQNKALGKRQTVCKLCQREYKRKHYYANKESHYKRNEKTNKKCRDYVDQYKSQHFCPFCKEKEPICLDFHHLRDKTKNIAEMIGDGSFLKLKKEIEKCIILCSNCHRKLHAGIINLSDVTVA